MLFYVFLYARVNMKPHLFILSGMIVHQSLCHCRDGYRGRLCPTYSVSIATKKTPSQTTKVVNNASQKPYDTSCPKRGG